MPNYHLFSVIGIEIEYMIVDANTLDITPKSDEILTELAGKVVNEFEMGPISVSNELVLHVLELKNNPPVPANRNLITEFQKALNKIFKILDRKNLSLLPTAAHPWMNPITETKRWPHDNSEIYQKYDEIFNCQGHGWSNLQSMHINLPFSSDQEFVKLHNAIRLILPLLPALAASSPILEGEITSVLDRRLTYYNRNQAIIPEIAGMIIPEFINSIQHYHEHILNPMYTAIKPYDPQGILQYEWLNSRGAIPKFDYQALEIRLLDTQECVLADLSIGLAINEILKNLSLEPEIYLTDPYPTNELNKIYINAINFGLDTVIEDSRLLKQLGITNDANLNSAKTMREVWFILIEKYCQELPQECQEHLQYILHNGNLSERILKSKPQNRQDLLDTYHTLAQCLRQNTRF